MKVTIIDYGAGNVFSVKAAFERLGKNAKLSADIEEIKSSDFVVFPGVGHAEDAMTQLKKTQIDLLLPKLKQPVLGICLGMQLMCQHTEEGNTDGLGIFEDLKVIKFDPKFKVPHMGWNNLIETKSILENVQEDVYFVHSYFAPISKYTIASCQYQENFSAALQKDNFFACQFHPEKSGELGNKILTNFLNQI